MSIAESKKYITELHKRQDNPYLWPDFLTGLHDKASIIKKLDEVYPLLGSYSIAYTKIVNIHSYLIKYGPDKHAEIIQWAAAILKTTCNKCKGCFVATVGTHDFVVMCQTKNIYRHIKDVLKIFNKKAVTYYTKEDQNNKTVLSFTRNGEKVNIGLMKMVSVILSEKPRTEKSILIREMGMACDGLGADNDNILILGDKTGS
jgi:hypothetical protein